MLFDEDVEDFEALLIAAVDAAEFEEIFDVWLENLLRHFAA